MFLIYRRKIALLCAFSFFSVPAMQNEHELAQAPQQGGVIDFRTLAIRAIDNGNVEKFKEIFNAPDRTINEMTQENINVLSQHAHTVAQRNAELFLQGQEYCGTLKKKVTYGILGASTTGIIGSSVWLLTCLALSCPIADVVIPGVIFGLSGTVGLTSGTILYCIDRHDLKKLKTRALDQASIEEFIDRNKDDYDETDITASAQSNSSDE